jgi:hypothetical protein
MKLQQHALQQERSNDRKQLYEAIHLCMMKIALIKEGKIQENYHPKISFIHNKDDLP